MNGTGTIASIRPAGTGTDVIYDALVAIRSHLKMEVAYFSEFVGDRSVFRRVDAPGLEHLIKEGDSQSLDDVYCNHILEGRLPELIADTSAEPVAQAMPITGAVPIGSHASVPIRYPDGRPYGMFCCLSPRPNPTLNERDLEMMRVFAGLATRQLHLELEEEQASHDRRRLVEAVIEDEAFNIVYQPIVDLASMRTVSFEALTRFRKEPYRSPDHWFADAAAVGLGLEMELAAIRAAIAAFPRLPKDASLSVNASPGVVTSGLLEASLDARHLDRTIVEITEHAQVDDYAALRTALDPLIRKGVKIAVDDAGAGFSGLRHIVQIAPDIIKMDMSLTRGIDEDRARRALASAMVYYGRETGAAVVAEGIETEGELLTLKLLGIHRGQGYLLGRPGALPAPAAKRTAVA